MAEVKAIRRRFYDANPVVGFTSPEYRLPRPVGPLSSIAIVDSGIEPNGELSVFEEWRARSATVDSLVKPNSGILTSGWLLWAAGGFVAACVALVALGIMEGVGGVSYPFALMFGIASVMLAGRWVELNAGHSNLLWWLERIRRSIAYEGDPGPRP